jgi:hypothetical protein
MIGSDRECRYFQATIRDPEGQSVGQDTVSYRLLSSPLFMPNSKI